MNRDDLTFSETFALALALIGEKCTLDHRMDPRGAEGDHMQATDWLEIPSPDGSTTLSLPICNVCAKSLQEYDDTGESDWYLIICSHCYQTLWIPRANSISMEPEMIHYVRDCPSCRDFAETAQMKNIWKEGMI